MRLSLRYPLVVAGLVAAACQNNTAPSSAGPLEAPASLSSISLDSAIFLDWADNAYLSDTSRFSIYRVYSASYDLNHGSCLTDWAIEGTTVAHVFLAGQLPNGVPRCFATSAISRDGLDSDWSPLWQDTPRPDARNVLVWAFGVNTPPSGTATRASWAWCKTATAATSISRYTWTRPIRRCGSHRSSRGTRCNCIRAHRWPI